MEYRALTYGIPKVHRLVSVLDSETEYEDGIIVKILGIEVYNNVK